MQLCLGATYSWNVFVEPLRRLTGLGQGDLQIPYSVFYITFPLTTLFSGVLLKRLGPRRCALLSGLLYGGGWMLAGLGRRDFIWTILGCGALSGAGVGVAYLVPIALCVQWFPKRKGLVTGFAVAGFGGGAALVALAAKRLMGQYGAAPFLAFQILGAVFFVLIVLAALALRWPEGAREEAERTEVAFLPTIRQRAFQILYGAMLAGLTAGQVVIVNLRELQHGGGGLEAGARAVALFAIANASGRIFWGWCFDRLPSHAVLILNLLAQAILLFFSPLILGSEAGLQVFALLAGLNYGGVLVLYASSAARQWGAHQVGHIYGWIFSVNALASLAPFLSGKAYDNWGNFTLSLYIAGGMALFAAIFIWKARSFFASPPAQ